MEENVNTGDNSNELMAKGRGAEKTKLDDYGEWMVVTRRKPKDRMVNRPQQTNQSQTSEVSPDASSIATPRMAEQGKREGKRKATHTQLGMPQWETGKTAESSQYRGHLEKGAKSAGFRAKTNQRAKGPVKSQPDKVGLGGTTGRFSFGPSQGVVNYEKATSSPFLFSSPASTSYSPSLLGKEAEMNISGRRRNGGEREVGVILQRKGDTSGGRDHKVDTSGSYRDMGLVRCGVDGSLEESIPADGVEPTGGFLAVEGRGLGNNSKPMVEVSDRQAIGTDQTADKLKAISNRIRGAEFGKISVRSRSGVDPISGYCEEDTSSEPSGMRDDGQPSPGENDTICRTVDQWHSADQGNAGTVGGDQTLNNSLSRGVGVEDGAVGSMEVEGQ
nr:hypothetical protein CFP56_77027 [Quercus suber]